MSINALLRLISIAVLLSVSAFAVDGVVLINQNTVIAAGGFPYSITQPGSYKLTGNLVVPVARNGIVIQASGVSLDLNGFSISTAGTGNCDGDATHPTSSCVGTFSALGISDDFPGRDGISIRNGSVTGMFAGVSFIGTGALVEEVRAFRNSSSGITIASGIVRRSLANNNGQVGIDATTADSLVTESVANANLESGIVALGSVLQSTASHNGRFGLVTGQAIWGSNSFVSNLLGPVNAGAGAVSQNNSNCDGSVC